MDNPLSAAAVRVSTINIALERKQESMKKSTKKILAVILAAVMIFAITGCKGKDSDKTDKQVEIKDPTPTPTPEVTMEDLFEVQKENFTDYKTLIRTVANDESVEFGDFHTGGDFSISADVDVTGYVNGSFKLNGDIDFKSFADTAYYLMNVNAQAATDAGAGSTGNTADEPDMKTKVEVYLEKDDENKTIKVYQNQDDMGWSLVEKTIAEILDQNDQDAENGATDPNKKETFKDVDKFLKDHTTMDIASGVFRNTTHFTLQEFRDYYRDDFNTMINELADTVFGTVYGEQQGLTVFSPEMKDQIYGVVIGILTEMINSMTGDITLVQEFNAELEPTDMKLECKDISFNCVGNVKMSLKIPEMTLNLKNKEIVKVEIPDDVKKSAVSVKEENNLFDPGSLGF